MPLLFIVIKFKHGSMDYEKSFYSASTNDFLIVYSSLYGYCVCVTLFTLEIKKKKLLSKERLSNIMSRVDFIT